MSIYYEADGITFKRVKRDIRLGRISGIMVAQGAEKARGQICVTVDNKNFAWLSEGVNKETLGLKVWGMNDADEIIKKLQKHYKIQFINEEELGIMHIG